MRYILLIPLLLAVLLPVYAQSDPLYIECDAEDYLTERYYHIQVIKDLSAEMESAEYEFQQLEVLADIYVAEMELRSFHLDYEGVPECVETLHELSLESTYAAMDYMALFFISERTSNANYAVLAGQRLADASDINKSIDEELVTLGWLTEDGEYTNEPPPLDNE